MADDIVSSALAGGALGGTGGDLAGTLGGVGSRTRELTIAANAFSRAMTSAFAQGVTGARSFDVVLKSLALRLSDLSLQLALRPLTNALGSGLSSLFNGLSGSPPPGIGDAMRQTSVQPFAAGGVIASPSYFPLSGGLGLAGEAGPEAIMPLARGSDGSLGVAASGSAPTNVTVNIATPDAESFRRSETYLTGLVARAVARGQRGM